jgi:hypothetical protein
MTPNAAEVNEERYTHSKFEEVRTYIIAEEMNDQ